MSRQTEYLNLRIPPELMRALRREAHKSMLTVSAYVRLVLAQHVGLIESPSVLVDTRAEYTTQEAHNG